MGFYLRKSVRVGPFRFNLSQHGVGVSAGVKGLRIGTGPRGNYVHMGRGGLYYRATFSSPDRPREGQPRALNQDPLIPVGTHAPLEEIESADASQIVDSSSRELLAEMNAKQAKLRLWPWIAALSFGVFSLGLHQGWPAWAMWGSLLLGLVITYAASVRDDIAKSVVLFYEFDTEMERVYEILHSSAQQMANAAAAWHIEAQGAVHDRKYHAGASDLVRRKKTTITRSAPPYVKTNIETISIGVGRQTLHFFPDRVLIYDERGVGSVNYRALNLLVKSTRFIEDSKPPRDAKIVDRTWRYVNKKGGPDRRFNNNTELPICLYDELHFKSSSGLNEVIQISKTGLGEQFAEAVQKLAHIAPSEQEHKSKIISAQ